MWCVWVGICSEARQVLFDALYAILLGEGERRVAAIRLLVAISPRAGQNLDDRKAVVAHGEVQRRLTELIGDRRVSTGVYQQLDRAHASHLRLHE